MASRKIYIGICNPEDSKTRALKSWVITNEEEMQDAQAEIAEFIGADFVESQEREGE